jgi:thiamine biosynthesis lipoprotein
MPSSSPVERARPALGCIVRVRAEGLAREAADLAIAAAFAEIGAVHRLMSFHEPQSDLSRIHRAAAGQAVEVDARTLEVLAFSRDLAARSGGAFDPTVGGDAVRAGALPAPADAAAPDADATWCDLVVENGAVRLARPLWLDLGGVAKGYAVDRAVAVLRRQGAASGCVNAGGDLRVFGEAAEIVALRVAGADRQPVINLSDGALASSGGDRDDPSLHLDGRTRRTLSPTSFACVTAPEAMAADALTKVVLALGPEAAAEVLVAYGAQAYAFSPGAGWRACAA